MSEKSDTRLSANTKTHYCLEIHLLNGLAVCPENPGNNDFLYITNHCRLFSLSSLLEDCHLHPYANP